MRCNFTISLLRTKRDVWEWDTNLVVTWLLYLLGAAE